VHLRNAELFGIEDEELKEMLGFDDPRIYKKDGQMRLSIFYPSAHFISKKHEFLRQLHVLAFWHWKWIIWCVFVCVCNQSQKIDSQQAYIWTFYSDYLFVQLKSNSVCEIVLDAPYAVRPFFTANADRTFKKRGALIEWGTEKEDERRQVMMI